MEGFYLFIKRYTRTFPKRIDNDEAYSNIFLSDNFLVCVAL